MIYTRCNVGAVWAVCYLYYRCGHCWIVAGKKRAQPRARERARQGTRVLSIASGACPALGSSQPRRAPAMLDTGHGSAGASSVMRFSVAHPNASNVPKATFVLQCCIDSDARATHCNALQPRHWRAMPDTRHTRQRQRGTSSPALARSTRGRAAAVLEAASGLGWAVLGAGCQLCERART